MDNSFKHVIKDGVSRETKGSTRQMEVLRVEDVVDI